MNNRTIVHVHTARQIQDKHPAGKHIINCSVNEAKGDIPAAIDDLTQALKLYSTDINKAEYYNARSRLYRKQGNFSEALEDATQAVELFGIQGGVARYYHNRSLVYHAQGNFTAALDDANQAIRLYTDDAQKIKCHKIRSLIYKAQGDSVAAEKEFVEQIYLATNKLYNSINDRFSQSADNFLKINYENLSYVADVGEGGFGKVYRGLWIKQDGSKQDVAIKVPLLKNAKQPNHVIENFLNEVSFAQKLSELRLANIAQFYGASIEYPNYNLVMTYMPNGSLRSLIASSNEINWSTGYVIMKDVSTAIKKLHDNQVLHRDLKSHNILLDENFRAYVADFGSAAICKEDAYVSKCSDIVTTHGWAAPELQSSLPRTYSKKSDIYGLGIIFWEMSSHKRPYQSDVKIIPDNCPPKVAHLIKWCTQPKPTDRPTAQQVLDYLGEEEGKDLTLCKSTL